MKRSIYTNATLAMIAGVAFIIYYIIRYEIHQLERKWTESL